MSATYLTVEIENETFDVYADIATADRYALGSTNGIDWAAATLTDDQKARYLVTSTRILDRMRWPGKKTDDDQPLAWPRTGVAGYDQDQIPQPIIDACCELALQLLAGVDVLNQQATNATGVRRQKAGSVEIEYFYGAGGVPLRLPLPVWELISGLLAGSASGGGARSFGTCGESTLDRPYGFSSGI